MSKKRVVVFGPGPQFKGGLANYTTSLAKAFDKKPNVETHLVSWSQQYPALIPRDFIDRSSQTDHLEGTRIKVKYITNYNNPFSWRKTYKYIARLNPDLLVFQWSIAIQGIPLGYISRKLQKHTDIEVIFDLHFVVQKERSLIDKVCTKYGIARADTYIAHAYKTVDELKEVFPKHRFKVNETGERATGNAQTVIKLYHPVYDMFQPKENFDVAHYKKKLQLNRYVFLFFGFIRKYKGLHNVIRAFAKVAREREDVSLLVVGESFWQTVDTSKFTVKLKRGIFKLLNSLLVKKGESEMDYRPLKLVEELGIQDKVTVVNEFVPHEEVPIYFQVSDAIMLYYLTATPSGVESMAYNFKLPMLATKVGHFPETVKDGYNGYLADPNSIDDMAHAMERFIEQPVPREHVAETARAMSWDNYVNTILNVSGTTQNKKKSNEP